MFENQKESKSSAKANFWFLNVFNTGSYALVYIMSISMREKHYAWKNFTNLIVPNAWLESSEIAEAFTIFKAKQYFFNIPHVDNDYFSGPPTQNLMNLLLLLAWPLSFGWHSVRVQPRKAPKSTQSWLSSNKLKKEQKSS